MDLKKENYTYQGLLCLVLFLCPLFFSPITAQSLCKVRVAAEPVAEKVEKATNKVTQSGIAQNKWVDLDNGIGEDNKSARITFSKAGISTILKFSDFNFNVPVGARIDGFIVSFKGRREGAGYVRDSKVNLVSGNTISDNFGGKGYNSANVFASGTTNKRWQYGFYAKTWGQTWSAAQINDASFGVEIELINITSKEVSAYIDDVKIEVEYTPLPTFCFTDCFPVYTDPVPGAFSYYWHIPQGFEMISRSEKNNIIDFKVTNAQAKIYNVCVDALDDNGKVIEQCCRDLRIRSCVPAKIGNFVWNDINYNGLQDANEPGISGVKVNLYTASGSLVSSTTTSPSGNYAFTNLLEEDYYIKVDVPSTYFITRANTSNKDLNSDFLQGSTTSSLFNLQYGDDFQNLDFGLVKKLSIGDFVWEDDNYNGIQDSGEKGISGVKVKLYNEGNVIIDSTITNDQGGYTFDNLIATKYKLSFALDSKYFITKAAVGLPSTDSDVKSGNTTDLINFENTSINNSIDAGFVRYGSIGDFVWNDANQNGIQDTNEKGEEGLFLYLKNEAGTVIDTTTTEALGIYLFDKILPGKYSIKIDLPDFTTPTVASPAPNGSDLIQQGSEYVTKVFTVTSGQTIDDVDLGYAFVNSSICGKVWNDIDGDGQYSIGEELVSEIPVALVDEFNDIVKSLLTNSDGSYCFDSLAAGKYKVRFTIGDDLQYTDPNIGNDVSDSDALERVGTAYTDVIDLIPGDTILNIDAGVLKKSIIGDYVWGDVNYNGIQDIDESGIEGIEMTLYDEQNNAVETQTTDEDGAYVFQQVVKGKYTLKATKVDHYQVSLYKQGTDVLNNDFLENFSTDIFSISLATDNLDLDLGLIKSLEIGDYVWEDMNGDGIQNIDEKGLKNIEIELYDAAGDFYGNAISDSNGYYRISNIPAIMYNVVFSAPSAYVPTKIKATTPELDSDVKFDGSTGLIDFQNIIADNTVDAGYIRYASIGDFVWHDANQNGIQDSGEKGEAAWLLYLVDNDGKVIDTAYTDADGKYLFDKVWPGKYRVILVNPTLIKPTSLSTANNGSDLEVVGNGFGTALIDVKSGAVIDDIDLGYILINSSICGNVWNDSNGDGQYTSGEVYLDGISVQLLDKDNDILTETITDNDGKYCFDSLTFGEYKIAFLINDQWQFTEANVGNDDSDSDATGSILEGFTSIIQLNPYDNILHVDAGLVRKSSIGDFIWLDANYNGIQDLDELGLPQVELTLFDSQNNALQTTVTDDVGNYTFDNIVKGIYKIKIKVPDTYLLTKALVSGDATNNDFLQNFETGPIVINLGSDNLNVDGGLIKALTLGNFVWEDSNGNGLQDSDEPGIGDVPVSVLDADGILQYATISDAEGKYKIENIPATLYKIVFDLETQYISTLYRQGTDRLIDNDCQIDHTTGILDFTNVNEDLSIDAGFYRTACIGDSAWVDSNEDGIRDANEHGLKDAMVTLTDLDNNVLQIYVTDSSGMYAFCNLKPGQYKIVFRVEKSYLPTIKGDDSVIDDVNGIFTTEVITVKSGQVLNNVDAGFIYRPEAKICGLTWKDTNGDGVYTSDEPAFPNVPMVLLDSLGNKIKKLKSDENGNYCIEGLAPAKYAVRFFINDDHQFTFAGIGSPDNDSDAYGITDSATTELLILKANEDLNFVYAGITMRSILGDFAWFDDNNNGLQDAGEVGIPGLTVSLYNESNQQIRSTLTDGTGAYTFDKIVRGKYKLQFPLNPSFNFAQKDLDDVKGSDINPDGFTNQITVVQNQNNLDIDAGYVLKGAIVAGEVWQDVNKDTIRGLSDILLKGIGVLLFDENDNLILETETDANGSYLFFPVQPGNYYLKFDSTETTTYLYNAGGSAYSDVDHSNGRGTTDIINVTIGSVNTGYDAGLVSIISSIEGTAWLDDNGNGVLDAGETPPTQVKVYLLSGQSAIDSTLTDLLTGEYKFDSLYAGEYFIKFDTINAQYNFTKKIDPSGVSVVSSVDENGLSDTIRLASCVNLKGLNAGYRGYGNLTGEAFLDENENGLNDDLVPGINNIAVCLIDENNQIVATDTTALINLEAGQFSFNKIVAGTYRLKVIRPLYYIFSPQDVNGNGNEDLDSDVALIGNFNGFSKPFVINTSASIKDVDFGLVFRVPMNSSIQGRAWEEQIVDGLRASDEASIEGQVMVLYDKDNIEIKRDTTDQNGAYLFTKLTEGFYYVKALLDAAKTPTFANVGNNEIFDNDFTDVNVEDATEVFYLGIGQDTSSIDLGVADETIIGDFVWHDENFNGLQDVDEPGLNGISIEVHDENGKLVKKVASASNGNYSINHLPATKYKLKFAKLDGYSASKQVSGNPSNDNDMGLDYNTSLIDFAAGQNSDIDAGYVKNGSIGNRIWVDFDANGIQNNGEPGKDSVEVQLCNSDGSFVGITQTYTDIATGQPGNYYFKDIRPGNYFIKIIVPAKYKVTLQGSANDELNSDINSEGVSQIFTLSPNDAKYNIDGGIFLPGCIGNRVWLDTNQNGIQDEGEVGVKDIDVKLFKSNGILVGSGKTDDNGLYILENLAQGLYYAEFKIEAPYKFTLLDQGEESTDNDANQNGVTPLISLAHGAKYYDLDAGVYIGTNPNEIISGEAPQIDRSIEEMQLVTPNPALNVVSINLPFESATLYLYDVNGKLLQVFDQSVKNELHNISNLKSGVYNLIARNGGAAKKCKFIKVD